MFSIVSGSFFYLLRLFFALFLAFLATTNVNCEAKEEWRGAADSGRSFFEDGNYETALDWTQKALAKIKLSEAPDSTLFNLYNLKASCHSKLNEFEKAKKAGEKALKALNKNDTEYIPRLSQAIQNIASYEIKLHNYASADSLYKKTVKLREEYYGAESEELAKTYIDYAYLHNYSGRYRLTAKYGKKALEIRKKKFKDDNAKILSCYNVIGTAYGLAGDLIRAKKYWDNVLESIERMDTLSPKIKCVLYNNVGHFYHRIGNTKVTSEALRKSFEIINKSDDANLSDKSGIITNLGVFYLKTGKLEEAEKYIMMADSINKIIYKNDRVGFANFLFNKSSLFRAKKEYDKSLELLFEALHMRKRMYKGDHLYIAGNLNAIGNVYFDIKQYDSADYYINKSLDMNRRLRDLPNVEHFKSMVRLGEINYERGKLEQCVEFFKQALEEARKILEFINYVGEKEREKYFNQLEYSFDKFNYYTLRLLENNPDLIDLIVENRILTKGALLNSTKKAKRKILNSGDAELIEIYKKWSEKKDMLAQNIKFGAGKTPSEEIKSAASEIKNLEKELFSRSEIFKIGYKDEKIKLEDIQNALDANEAAVEIIRIPKVIGNNPIYFAVIIAKDTADYVILDSANNMETRNIKQYKKSIALKLKDNFSYTNFWEASATVLKEKNIETAYISRDGVYNFINVATLFNPQTKKYFFEEIQTLVIGNVKDIVKIKQSEFKFKHKEAILVGNPNFEKGSETVSANFAQKPNDDKEIKRAFYISAKDSSKIRGSLQPLPGTKIEIDTISYRLSHKGWNIKKMTEEGASEEFVKSVKNPKILHIASHGLFLQNPNEDGDRKVSTDIFIANPLFRSMLLLSGAQNALTNSSDNTSGFGKEDGLLTAYEAMDLDLEGTDIVALSACQTGMGEIKNGEGVYGLQRAFQIAGAKYLILSLWKVDDDATRKLMVSFYDNLSKGKKVENAFREAMAGIKKQYNHPYYWGPFVLISN